MKRLAALAAALVSVNCGAQEVIPDFYHEPGLSEGRSLIDDHPSEVIDPFNGGLQIHHVDIHLPGNGGFDLDVVRSYNTKTEVPEANPSSYYGLMGVGWTIHFGRVLSKFSSLPCATTAFAGNTLNNPVVELPDGSRQLIVAVGTPVMMTTSYWNVACEPNGIGMIVTSPNGVRYDMNHQVNVGNGNYSQTAWYTTKITDRNGNYATVNYASAAGAEISSVSTSDGRTVSFTYLDQGQPYHRVSTITAGATKFTYAYTQLSGIPNTYSLTTVTRPDGTTWKYSYNGLLSTTPGSYLMQKITYPQGGTLSYTYDWVYFDTTSNMASRATVIKTKTSSDGGSWAYTYTPGSPTVYDTTVVAGPEGVTTYKHIGANYASSGSVWEAGLLMQKTLQTGSTITQTESYTWGHNKISDQTNVRPGAFNTRFDPEVDVPVQTGKTIVRDGATYRSTVNAFDSYGNVTKTTEAGPNSSSRITNYTYYFDSSKWIMHELASKQVTGGVTIAKGFDTHGNVNLYNKDGVQWTYVYNSDGTVSSSLSPNKNTTSYSGYKCGVAQTENQPEGVNIARVVNSNCDVTSVTDGESHTTQYDYDGLHRVKSITYPTGNGVTITYAAANKKATRGALVETTYYDGFGRPATISMGGIVYTYKYDALGRITFASNPGASIGTTYGGYDILGRYTAVTDADGSKRSIMYGAALMSVTDERAHTTTTHYLSYGDPDEKYESAIDEPIAASNITIKRDGWNRVKSVTQGGLTRGYVYDSLGYLDEVDDPERSVQYSHDNEGNVTYKGILNALYGTNYYYDGQNRVYKEMDSGAPAHEVDLSYYKTGRLNTVQNTALINSTVKYTYDANDNLKTQATTVDGMTFTTSYDYTANDQLQDITYPQTGTLVSFSPDTLGRPTAVSGFASGVTYWPSGQVKAVTYANGVTSTYGQNARLWPSSYAVVSGSTALVNSSYGYDGLGNLSSVKDTAMPSLARTYNYDALNRLTVANGPWGSGLIGYDAVGNIKSQTFGSFGISYSYDSTNKLTSISGSRATTFAYGDNWGEVTAAYGNTYTYDSAFNLTSVNAGQPNQITYLYDGKNQRLIRSVAGVKTYEIYDGQGKLILEYAPSNGQTTEHFYLNGHRIAQRAVNLPPVGGGTQPTSIILSSLLSKVSARQNATVTLKAAVIGVMPTGQIVFADGATPLCTGNLDASSGIASCNANFAAIGNHTVSVAYKGDNVNAPSAASQTITVVAPIVVSARPSPVALANAVVFSTAVTNGAAGGTVTFSLDGQTAATASVGPDGTASATGNVPFPPNPNLPTIYSVVASYSGDATHPASTSDSANLVEQQATTITSVFLWASSATIKSGQNIRLSAALSPALPSNYVAGGSFVFYDNGTPLPSTKIYDDTLGLAVLNVALTSVGSHSLSVKFQGANGYAGAMLPTPLQVNVTN